MATGYAHINIDAVDDVAPQYGMGEAGECRPLATPLGAKGIGASFYRMKPGKRHGFGHSHNEAEEMYLVLEGSGRVKIDDDILDLATLDVVRLAPAAVREFEGGPDGMTLIAFGDRVKDDATMVQDFWPQS